MDWFKGKSTGSHRFSHEIWGFPVNFPLTQSIDEANQPSSCLGEGALHGGQSGARLGSRSTHRNCELEAMAHRNRWFPFFMVIFHSYGKRLPEGKCPNFSHRPNKMIESPTDTAFQVMFKIRKMGHLPNPEE
jgi:hypothetical protein